MRADPSDGPKPPIPQSYWVRAGRFAAGEYPGHPDSHRAAAKVRRLLKAGIDHFIDLTHPADRMRPYTAIATVEAKALNRKIVIESHPIVDMSVPADAEAMSTILDSVDAALEADKTVYLHCWGGIGRTGTVVGCWLVRHGRTGHQALQQIADKWRTVPKSRYNPYSPQTLEQHEYVRDWARTSPKQPV